MQGIPCVAGDLVGKSANLLLGNRFWKGVPTSGFLRAIPGDHRSLCSPHHTGDAGEGDIGGTGWEEEELALTDL